MTRSFFDEFVKDVESAIGASPADFAFLCDAMQRLHANHCFEAFGYYEAGMTARECADALIATACPDCGAPLYVDDSVLKFDRGMQSRVRAALCSGCEFVHEF